MSQLPTMAPRLARLVLVAAVVWHLIAVLSPPRQRPPRDTEGRDYASYHYALKVALEGGDPYDKAHLDRRAQIEGTRTSVHPFFYPPPFLGTMVWAAPLRLLDGFTVWFWINELMLLVAALALMRWWTPLSPWSGPAVLTLVAIGYPVVYGAELGQANLVVLGLVVVAGWQADARPRLAGTVAGLACMMKMAPAVLVLWWLVQRRWQLVGAAVATAVAATVLVWPLVGFWTQLRFYGEVLPELGAGNYNGLTIKLGMFGNHSLPNLLHQLFPSGTESRLSGLARLISLVLGGGLLAWLIREWRVRSTDRWSEAAQFSGLLVFMLLVPAYTYAHHLVFALPALVVAISAVERGVLGPSWAGPIALCTVVWAYPLPFVKKLAEAAPRRWAGCCRKRPLPRCLRCLHRWSWWRGRPIHQTRSSGTTAATPSWIPATSTRWPRWMGDPPGVRAGNSTRSANVSTTTLPAVASTGSRTLPSEPTR